MGRESSQGRALSYLKRNIRFALVIATLISVLLIVCGMLLPQDSVSWRIILKAALIETGVTILMACTLGVFLTEAYNALRELTVQNEVFNLVDHLAEMINHPEEFKTFQMLSYMEQAGLLAFFPSRKGVAQDNLRMSVFQLLQVDAPTTVYVIGDTLRVFFGPEGPFTYAIHQVLSEKPNVTLKVLLLNPNSQLAVYRSESETPETSFETDEQYRKAGLFQDSMNSSTSIQEWIRNLTSRRGNKVPIEVRYYDCADYCFAAIFPGVCYTAQYVYADAEARVQTPGIPMLKYAADSDTYKRLLWNFNWIWENASISYEELGRLLDEQPVIRSRSSALGTAE